MGGSRQFCVQCGHELKPDLRFCVACGRAVPVADPTRTSSDQVTWPSKGSYQPTEVSARPALSSPPVPANGLRRPVDQPAPALDGFSRPTAPPVPPPDGFSRPTAPPVPAAGDVSRRPDQFSPPPGEGGPGSQRPADQPRPSRPPRDPRSRRPAGGARSRRPTRGPRSRRPLVALIAVLLPAAVAAAVAYFLLGPSHPANPSANATRTGAGHQGTAQASAASPSISTSTSPSTTQVSEQQAASNLAGLLSQSVKDRSSITAAVNDVSSCGPSLSQDAQTLQNAATSRQQLLSQLAGLSGRSALSAAMLQSLTGAWQASAAADQDLGKWAQDEVSKGCTPNDQADANFRAAMGPDRQATTDKKAFVGRWNSIAARYGLTEYQWNQL